MNEKNGLIVLCDDDYDEKEIFQLALNKGDFNCDLLSFDHASILMDYLLDPHSKIPDIIFMDVDLPQVSGITCLETIRIRYSADDLPIVMYSLNSNPMIIDRAKELGANFYLIKPTEIQKLFEAIQDILESCKNPNVEASEFVK